MRSIPSKRGTLCQLLMVLMFSAPAYSERSVIPFGSYVWQMDLAFREGFLFANANGSFINRNNRVYTEMDQCWTDEKDVVLINDNGCCYLQCNDKPIRGKKDLFGFLFTSPTPAGEYSEICKGVLNFWDNIINF